MRLSDTSVERFGAFTLHPVHVARIRLTRCTSIGTSTGENREAEDLSKGTQPWAAFQCHRASAIFVSTAATLGAMTAFNVYRARKAEREHPPTGRFVTVDGVRLHYLERAKAPQSFCFTATW
jgi:hypothetical protein